MRIGIVVAFAALASCSPAPRDDSWFEAHPEVAEELVAACAAGARSNECDSARSGLSRAQATARMERYRKGFD